MNEINMIFVFSRESRKEFQAILFFYLVFLYIIRKFLKNFFNNKGNKYYI